MLYFKALTEGLSALPQADPAVRAALDARAAREGWPALHAELARVDPATAARLAPTDAQRIQRALEVHAIDRPAAVARCRGAARRRRPTSARRCRFALVPRGPRSAARGDRAALRRDARRGARRRAARAARALSRSTPAMPSMRCVGYRQAWDFLDGAIDLPTLRARAASPRRASSPSASSPGCARSPRRPRSRIARRARRDCRCHRARNGQGRALTRHLAKQYEQACAAGADQRLLIAAARRVRRVPRRRPTQPRIGPARSKWPTIAEPSLPPLVQLPQVMSKNGAPG